MNTIDTMNTTPMVSNAKAPALTRKTGNKAFEVYVHFSKTSTETMTDKIMRLVHNDIHSTDMT